MSQSFLDDPISSDDLSRVIQLMRTIGVDLQRFEVKSSRRELSKDLPRTLSAFSNGGGGVVICGLSEKDGFTPVEGFDAASIQDSLARVCSESMTPPVRPLIQIMEFEGHSVVVASVAEMRPVDKPCYVTSANMYMGSYIRTGDGDRRLSPYEVDRLVEEHRQPQHDLEVVEQATLADLDSALVNGLLARERRVHARNFAQLDDETALIRLGAARRDASGVARPTLAGLLSLGLYPQEFFPRLNVSFACYPGVRKSDVSDAGQRLVDSATMVGPIPQMVEDAIAAVERNTRTGAVIDGAFRREVRDYPVLALREAIVNALMHRDYSPLSQGTPVQIDLYVDRLEIVNPGGLYGNVTINSLGKDGVSASRNQYLSNLLESTPYGDGSFVAENRGTGYQVIMSELTGALMPPPEPFDTISSFRLVFERRRLARGETTLASSEAVRAVVMGLLKDQVSISSSEVANASGRSKGTVLKHINQMVEEGILEPTRPIGSSRQRYRKAGARD